MRTKQTIRIVLSSPGDVVAERRVMKNVIEELNDVIAADRDMVIELSSWETDAYAGFHPEGPQGIIDGLLKIEECDILLGIFWKRFGTPTMDSLSGTEHEIRTAIKSNKKILSPQIMIYFKTTPFYPQSEEEIEQFKRVKRFQNDFPKEGFYWEFEDVYEFEQLARRHLAKIISTEFSPTKTYTASGNLQSNISTHMRIYCKAVQKSLSTINIFGNQEHSVKNHKVPNRMKSIDHGFVQMNLCNWDENFDQREVEKISIGKLFDTNNEPIRILVRGMPGGGKTTLLRYIGYQSAKLGVEGKKNILPIFIRLRNFLCNRNTLEDFIRQQINIDCYGTEMCDSLCDRNNFLESSTLLLLDGLDEIMDHDTSIKISQILDEFVREHPRCNIIVTSRPVGVYREDYPHYRSLDLLSLSSEMIDSYLVRWFAENKDHAENLKKIFSKKPRIKSLATNPFMLSMIVYTFEKSGKTQLVENRSQLYQTCTRYLFERSYDFENCETVNRPSSISYSKAIQFLKDLSLRFFLWEEAEFPLEQVNIIGNRHFTAKELGLTEKFLNYLQRETGLIQRFKNSYTFVHRTLWEYYTSLAIADRSTEFLIRHAANPEWEEVVRLYAGLIKGHNKFTALIKSLWNINRPLALRAATEGQITPAKILRPLIQKEHGNRGKMLIIDALEQSMQLVVENERKNLLLETLSILLVECRERDCEVIYHAERLLERMSLNPIEPGGLIYKLLDLKNSSARQKVLLADSKNNFKWIEIEGGIFSMGDEDMADARPVRLVKSDNISMSKHPVTNRMLNEFQFVQKQLVSGGDNHPAVNITWWEAYYFALWVDARLPTEAEWEYAARGGKKNTNSKYYFGDDPQFLYKHAWFDESDNETAHEVNEINPHTGRENVNPLGLANMLGNIWEWCLDWFDRYPEMKSSNEIDINPKGPARGLSRVLRGGSFAAASEALRCARRGDNLPNYRDSLDGFRLVTDTR